MGSIHLCGVEDQNLKKQVSLIFVASGQRSVITDGQPMVLEIVVAELNNAKGEDL